MNNRPNDWFATRLFQPDLSIADLYASGVTPDNSELKPKDAYRDIPEVQKAFTVNGKFDENKFDQFYNVSLSQYNEYANNEFEKQFIQNYSRDAYDWTHLDKPVADTRARIVFGKNPMRTTQGIKNITQSTDSDFSIREIAQTNKVRDEEGNILDWTPNDKGGLFKSLGRPTLALAAWDEDGEHMEDGRMVQHMKGEYKFDEDGMPYYEVLGNRESYGKDVLHWSDTFTVDGTKLNKFDPFDSDGKTKSIGSTIAKTALNIAPLLIPYVGRVYGAVRAGVSMMSLFPTLGKALNGIITGDNDNTLGQNLTQLENYAQRFQPSVSDEGRSKMWGFENMANLVGQVGGQLFEQQSIAMIPRLLGKNGNIVQQAKLGQNMALAYMAGTSSTEVYGAFKEAGASDRVAGLAMLGNTLALWKLMNIDYFKDKLFAGGWLDENIIKNPAWRYAESQAGRVFIQNAESELTEEAAKNVVKHTAKTFGDAMKDYLLKNEMVPRAISEGIEEVMEEVLSDSIKGFTKAVEALGVDVTGTDQKTDFGFSVGDILSRYSMAFVGGSIGGGIFHLQNKYNAWLSGEATSNTPKDDLHDLIVHMTQKGGTQQIKDYYTRWHKQGKFGSINLSGTKFVQDALPGAKNEVLAEADTKISQNDAIYNMLMQQIDYIDNILNQEGLSRLTDARLIDSIKQQVPEFDSLPEIMQRLALIESVGINNAIMDDLVNIGTEIVETRAKMDSIIKVPNGDTAEAKREADEYNANNLELQNLQKRLLKLREERDAIINGQRNDNYINLGLMAVDLPVLESLVKMDLDSFCRTRYGKVFSELSEYQQFEAKTEYDQFKKTEGKQNLYRAAETYRIFSERYSQKIMDVADQIKTLSKDSYKSTTFIADQLINLQNAEAKFDKSISELEANTSRTPEQEANLKLLREESQKLKAQIELINSNPQDYLRTYFANNSYDILWNALNDPTGRIGLFEKNSGWEGPIGNVAENLKSLYKAYADNKMILNNDFEYNEFFRILRKYRATTDAKTKWNDAANLLFDFKFGEDPDVLDGMSDVNDMALDWGRTLDESDLFFDGRNSELQNENLNKLYELIKAFDDNLGLGDEQLAYDNLVNFIKEHSNLTDAELKNLLYNLLPNLNNEPIIDFIHELDSYKNRITYSPFNKLFSEFSADILGHPIPVMDLINSELKTLSEKSRLSDYVIDSKYNYEQLKSARKLAEALTGIIHGAYDGYNQTLNPVRAALEKSPLAEIDPEIAKRLEEDAILLDKKIGYLLQLHESNQSSKLKTQKDIAINMRPKFIEGLLNDVFVKDFLDKFGINLADLWPDEISTKEVKESNWDDFEKTCIKFETAIFDEVKKLNLTDTELTDKLISLFGDDIYKMESTRLSTDSAETVTCYDQAINLLSIMKLNTNDFYVKLRGIVEDSEFPFAPIYGQETAIRTSIANALNPTLFNDFLHKIKDKAPHDQVDKDEDQKYLSQKKVLENAVFIFGGAGTGKTTAIGQIIARFLNSDESTFVLTASTEKQTINLGKAVKLNESDSKSYTKDELIRLISSTGEGIKDENILLDPDNSNFASRIMVPTRTGLDVSDKAIFDESKKYRYMIMDEVGGYSAVELELIRDYCIAHNIFLIGLGDQKQSSAKIKYKEDMYPSNIEDCYIIKCPSLDASLRVNNVAKLKNYNVINTALSTILKEYQKNPAMDNKTRSQLVDKELSAISPELKYYEDDNRLVGEKSVDSVDSLIEHIKKVSKFSKNIVIYADDPSNSAYQALKSDGTVVDVLPTINTNGAEYDYIFVDKDWKKYNELGSSADKYAVLQDFYTITQRSTQGTVFINNGLVGEGGLLNFKQTPSDPKVNGDVALTDGEIKTFKDWRLKTLKDLTPTEDYDSNLYPKEMNEKPKDKPESTPPPTEDDLTSGKDSSDPPKNSAPTGNFDPVGNSGGKNPEDNPSADETGKDDKINEDDGKNPDGGSKPDVKSDPDEGKDNLGNQDDKNPEELPPPTEPDLRHKRKEQETEAFRQEIKEYLANNANRHLYYTGDYLRDLWDPSSKLYSSEIDPNNVTSLYNVLNEITNQRLSEQTYKKILERSFGIVINNKSLKDNFNIILEEIRKSGLMLKPIFKKFIDSSEYSIQLEIDSSNRRSKIYAQFDGMFNGNKKTLRIPIGYTNQIVNGRYTGDFWLARQIKDHKNRTQRQTLEELFAQYPGIYHLPTSGILTIGEEQKEIIAQSNNFNQPTKDFALRNNGKHFILYGLFGDVTTSESRDYYKLAPKSFVNDDGTATDYFYKDHKNFKNMGIQKRISMVDVLTYAFAITSKNKKLYNQYKNNTSFKAFDLVDTDGKINLDSAYKIFLSDSLIKELNSIVTRANQDIKNYSETIHQINANWFQILPEDRTGRFLALCLSANLWNDNSPEAERIRRQIQQNILKQMNDYQNNRGLMFEVGKQRYVIHYNVGQNNLPSTYKVYLITNNTINKDTPFKEIDARGINGTTAIIDLINQVKEKMGLPVSENGLDPNTDKVWLCNYSTKNQTEYITGANESITKLFMGIDNKNALNRIFNDNPYFVDSVFTNDAAGDSIDGKYWASLNGRLDGYTTDIDAIEYPVYSLDPKQVVPVDTIPDTNNPGNSKVDLELSKFEDFIDRLNQMIRNLNVDINELDTKEIIKNADTPINFSELAVETIDMINTANIENITNPVASVAIFEFNRDTWDLSARYLDDPSTHFVDNFFESEDWVYVMAKDESYKPTWKNWNYEIISVPLDAESNSIYLIYKNAQGEWVTSSDTFKSFNEYKSMMQTLSDLDPEIKRNIVNYIMELQLDQVNDSSVNSYLNALENMDEATRNSVENSVNNYLIKRLENHEC